MSASICACMRCLLPALAPLAAASISALLVFVVTVRVADRNRDCSIGEELLVESRDCGLVGPWGSGPRIVHVEAQYEVVILTPMLRSEGAQRRELASQAKNLEY